jgi:AraC-like DNA-binding protein
MDLTGISTKQYLLLIQLEQSRKILLEDEEATIVDVSLRCGFENVNTFSTAFKRVYHLSPTEFRRKKQSSS